MKATPSYPHLNHKTLGLALSALSAVAFLLAACGGRATPVPATEALPAATSAPAATESVSATQAVAPAVTEAPAATLAPAITEAPATKEPTARPAVSLPGDPKQAILAAQKAAMKAGPYRVHMVSTDDQGTTSESNGEVILPDRFHMMMANGTVEMLVVGNKSYMKQGESWMQFPVDFGSLVASIAGSLADDAEKSISDARLVGPDAIDGAPMMVYQYTYTSDITGQTITSNNKLWVGLADGLPHRQEVEGDFGGVKSKVVQDIVFDPTIKIEAPEVVTTASP